MDTLRSRKVLVLPQGSGGPTESDWLFRAGGHMQGEERWLSRWPSTRSHTSKKQTANGEVTSHGLQWPRGSPERHTSLDEALNVPNTKPSLLGRGGPLQGICTLNLTEY